MIGEFRALNWRSFERAHWFFERKNLLIGRNGSGKSNLLEALGFLGILRSFRTPRIGELIRKDTQEFHLRGVWQEERSKTTLETGMTAAGERLAAHLQYPNRLKSASVLMPQALCHIFLKKQG